MNPKIYTNKDHSLQRHLIDQDALWAIEQLKEAGHTAYIVGGSIRDLLLGKTPKDYDISTSARPEEIKRVFQRRCLIIGRRFRLAHLRFGNKVIETSTFRSGDPTQEGLILRDNSWGTEEEDVFRRDFTINALYYDPDQEIIIDYVDGLEDISRRMLRTIGDPVIRFSQDPVRMIRMLKFQARFNLIPDEDAISALEKVKEEILKSAPARIFEEIMKMLESGHSLPFFDLMKETGFLKLLLPLCDECLESESGPLFRSQLQAIDHMMSLGYKESIDRNCLTAALLFPLIEHSIVVHSQKSQHPLKMGTIFSLLEAMLSDFTKSSFAHFPKKTIHSAFHILFHQFRLTPLRGSPRFSFKFPSNEEFRNALTLLSLRASIDHELVPLWNAWKEEYESRPHHLHDEHDESEREHADHHSHAQGDGSHRHRRRNYRYRRRRYGSSSSHHEPNKGNSE